MTDIQTRIRALAPGLQLVSLATVTETGAPWVRLVAGRMMPDLSIWFSTHLSSRKIAQLRRDPRVHATLGATDFTAQEWLQVEGRAEISTAQGDREAFWFDGLLAYVSGVDDPEYAVVKVIPDLIEIGAMGREPLVWQAG